MRRFEGTKGKWSVFNQDEDIHIENESSSEAIATLVGWNNEKEGDANAKLIAAAPQLLEAILYYFDVLEEVRGKDFKDKPDHVLSKMINAVNNALS